MDELREALTIASTGMGVVFLALILLVVLMLGLNRFLSRGEPGSPKPTEGEGTKGEKMATEASVVSIVSTPLDTRDELEEVAVLAAVMALAMEPGSDPALSPQVLLLPVETSVLWRVQGRQQLMERQGRPQHGWRR